MNCTICDSEIDVDNGDVVGSFAGAVEVDVAFCIWCVSCLQGMFGEKDYEDR